MASRELQPDLHRRQSMAEPPPHVATLSSPAGGTALSAKESAPSMARTTRHTAALATKPSQGGGRVVGTKPGDRSAQNRRSASDGVGSRACARADLFAAAESQTASTDPHNNLGGAAAAGHVLEPPADSASRSGAAAANLADYVHDDQACEKGGAGGLPDGNLMPDGTADNESWSLSAGGAPSGGDGEANGGTRSASKGSNGGEEDAADPNNKPSGRRTTRVSGRANNKLGSEDQEAVIDAVIRESEREEEAEYGTAIMRGGKGGKKASWPVESILDKRIDPDGPKYLIKWKVHFAHLALPRPPFFIFLNFRPPLQLPPLIPSHPLIPSPSRRAGRPSTIRGSH